MLRPYPTIGLKLGQVLRVMVLFDGLMVGVPCTVAKQRHGNDHSDTVSSKTN